MFLKSISFKKNVVFESKRNQVLPMFKVKSRTFQYENRRRPIYDENHNHKGYEKRTVTEKTFVIFKKGLTIEFDSNITVIVGDNGCGKTSLIRNIAFPKKEFDECKYTLDDELQQECEKEVSQKWLNNEDRQLNLFKLPTYVIVEKNIHKNSHIAGYKDFFTDNTGFMPPQHMLDIWDMESFSNGENNLDFLGSLKSIKNSILVLDEPETSLSLKSQIKILDLIKELAIENQVILITHSEKLMGLVDNVYDFEKKRYVNTKRYIKSQIK